MKDYRWVSCAKDVDWATAQYRHLVVKGGRDTLCGATASHSDVWRGNSTKPVCQSCMTRATQLRIFEEAQEAVENNSRQKNQTRRATEIVAKLARVEEMAKKTAQLLQEVEALVREDYVSADGAEENVQVVSDVRVMHRVGFHRGLRRLLNDWEGYLAARKE